MSGINETKQYIKTLGNLCTFLNDAGIEKIIFHQFDFLMLYFPVYMIVNDLKRKRINIDFEIIESDEKILEQLKGIESLDYDKSALNLGLCEPVLFNKEGRTMERSKEYQENVKFAKYSVQNSFLGKEMSYFMHLPFINFPPLYGIALKNNPKINKIKRTRSEEGNDKVSIVDYWKHFSAKLSLLGKGSFKEDGLSASLYPKGSTTDWFIRTKDGFNFRKRTWIKNLETEFDDLFHGQVDVAFTIQPWDAVVRSETEELPVDIDVVYKNVCREYDSTSLIFHTKVKEHLIFGDYILNCFNNLLKEKIKELYETEASALDEMIKDYCEMLAKYCKDEKHKDEDVCNCLCHALPGKSFENCINKKLSKDKKQMENGCLFENKMALRLTNDSQIYKQLESIEETSEVKAVATYFVEKFGETEQGIAEFESLEEKNDNNSN